MVKVGVIDYGMGNLRSVEKGLQKAGVAAEVCSDPARFDYYDGLVLPGVGAFGDAMQNIKDRGIDAAVMEYVGSGRQLLWIFLGMQIMLEFSDEHGRSEGLGMVPGGCLMIPDVVKVPHMGWNILTVVKETPLFSGLAPGDRFYFVHSFYCAPADDSWVVGTTDYGLEFACAIGRDNVWGLQFHPEKSSLRGLKILSNFGKMVEAAA